MRADAEWGVALHGMSQGAKLLGPSWPFGDVAAPIVRYGIRSAVGSAEGSGDGGACVGVTSSLYHRRDNLLVVPLKFDSRIDDRWDGVIGVAADAVGGLAADVE